MSESGQFFDEFIDDYFSECDEHLATVRRVLLLLEDDGASLPDAGRLQELSRALHTLKGLSGMVSLAAAEVVAHAMEDVLRVLPRQASPPRDLLESLFAGESLLERCVAARRVRAASPEVGAFVSRVRDVVRLHALDGDPSTAMVGTAITTSANRSPIAAEGVDRVVHVEHRFEFVPSAALASRGVGVELIRQRLASLGEITSTVPRVRPTGGVAFEFVVAIRPDAVLDEAWRIDGLSWEPWTIESPYVPDAAADAVSPEGRAASTTTPPISNVVRVDLTRLDDLMRMVGELVVTRARLGQSVERAASGMSSAVWEEINESNELIERQLRTIREGVTRIRLVQIGEVFERMRFAMRDIARETGKAIHLEVSGQDTEIDKLVVDRMLEPLLHLVRNAASHGIESRTERLAAGKPAQGTIALRAQAAGDRIVLEVEDDGAGIDVARVAARARFLGLAESDEIASDALLDLISTAGFSTRESADMASGRGVGMAVVRTTIRALGGELFVDSTEGRGTRFTIELPLTLMITDALIVEIGDQAMAIPQVALREIIPLDPAAVTRFERNQVLSYRGRVVPLVSLSELFKFHLRGANAAQHVLIVGTDSHLAGLIVDRVLGLREIVVHPIDDPLIAVPGVAGATELADGRVSLILDAPALVRGTRNGRVPQRNAMLGVPSAAAAPTAAAIPEQTWR